MKLKIAAIAALMSAFVFADAAEAFQRRGGSSRSSGSSWRSSSSSSRSKPSTSTQRRSSSSSSRSSATKPSSSSSRSSASKPSSSSSRGTSTTSKPKTPSGKYDTKAATAARRTTSQADYQKKSASYKQQSTANSSRISSVSGRSGKSYSRNDYDTRDSRRQTVVYNTYVGQSYPSSWGGFNDGISPFFWMWMMSEMSHSNQAQYIHNHGASLDQARLNELYASNAQLQAEVAALKASGVAPDPSVLPEGMDAANADLMFTDDFAATAAGINAPLPPAEDEGWGFWVWALIIVAGGSVVIVLMRTVKF